jgi:hypothetical protein
MPVFIKIMCCFHVIILPKIMKGLNTYTVPFCVLLANKFTRFSSYVHCMFMYLHRASWHSSPTLTEVFPCFFLSCKANARVKSAKIGHGPHSS